MRQIKRVLTGAVAAAACAAGIASAAGHLPAAGAATAPLQVSLSACGNGSGVSWSASGDPQLTIGTAPAATCGAPAGSTYDPAYAQAVVNLASTGTAEPAAAPSFTTDNYAAGSPRWVIVLSNKAYLFGYPAQLGAGAAADFTGPQWSPNGTACNANTYVTYAAAIKCADPNAAAAVTQAYVVMDADQAAGTTDTISGLQYNGQDLPVTGFVADSQLRVPGPLVLDDRGGSHANGTAAQVWEQAGVPQSAGVLANQSFQPVTLANGNTALRLANTNLCLDVKNFGTTPGTKIQLWACGASASVDQQWKQLSDGSLEAVNATDRSGTVMVLDDPLRGGNGTQLQIWSRNGLPQQQWTLP